MGLTTRSESCCCGCSVRAGTLILLYWELLGLIIGAGIVFANIKNIGIGILLPIVIGFCIVIAGLVAVSQGKPALLIPFFIYRIILAVVIIFGMIILVIITQFGVRGVNQLQGKMESFGGNNAAESLLDNMFVILVGLLIVEIGAIILEIHFAKVVYSCYRELELNLTGKVGYTRGTPQWPSQWPVTQSSSNVLPTHTVVQMNPQKSVFMPNNDARPQ